VIIIVEGKKRTNRLDINYVSSKVKVKKEFDIKDRPSVRKFMYHFFSDCGIVMKNVMIEKYLISLKKIKNIVEKEFLIM
jgi:hypothetical protein